jgi:hypothetical protein
MQNCAHCGSEFEQAAEGCCPRCGQALAVPASEKDLWFPYYPTEQLFQHACAVLLAPPQPAVTPRRPQGGWMRHFLSAAAKSLGQPDVTPWRPQWGWFLVNLVSLGLFALVLLASSSAAVAGILVAVVLFHELGHYAGMRLCGYRDVSIFFVPFLGGAAVGVKERAPVWQQVLVLLLGPGPGIVVGSLLWMGLVRAEHPALCQLVSFLVAINLANLAPLDPLDGGRLVNLLLFYRHPRAEAAVLLGSAAGLVLLGAFLFTSWILIGFGVLVLLQVSRRYAVAKAARRLAAQWPDLPVELDKLSQTQLRDTFRQVLRALPDTELSEVVRGMREVHERAAVQPLGIPLKALFLAACAGLIGLTFVSGSVDALPTVVLPHPSTAGGGTGSPGLEPGVRGR